MVASTFNTSPAASKPTSFLSTLGAEWAKLTSLRSTYVTLLVTLVLAVGLSGLITWAIGSSFDEWDPVAVATYEPIMMSFFGIVFGTILLCLLGVTFVASEYGNGMIRLTLTSTPRRGRVLLAKMIIIAVVTLVVGTVMAVSTFLIGQWILGLYDLPTASLSDPDAQRAILGLGLTAPVFPLIGAALGVLFRSTAAAISAVLALIFTPAIFGAMLPTWWQENVLRYLPDRAIDSFAIGPLMTRDASEGMAAMMGGGTQYLDPNVGALVTVAWLVVFIGAASIALFRRDV